MVAIENLTTTPAELLSQLRECGAAIWIDGSDLRLRLPAKILTPEVKAAVRECKAGIMDLLQAETPIGSGVFCDRCGKSLYRDVPIHGGRSIRRDCLSCGRFLDFPVWNQEQQQEA